MVTWEYAHVEVPNEEAGSWTTVLDRLGWEGWELVERTAPAGGAVSLVLKRPIEQPRPALRFSRTELAERPSPSPRSDPRADRAPTAVEQPNSDLRGRRYYAVVWDVLASIADGSLSEGDRLPNERQLASLSNAARSTVRDALLVLELLGVVEVRPGSGTYVSENSGYAGVLGSVHFDAPPRVLIEAREQIEPAVAALCAARATKTDIARLRRLVDDCEREARRAPPDAPESFLQLSMQFHSDLAALCGNEILAKITQQLVDVTAHPLWMVVNGIYLRTAESRATQVAEHRAVLEAIAQRHADVAAAAMDDHLCSLSVGVFGQSGRSRRLTAQRWRGRSAV